MGNLAIGSQDISAVVGYLLDTEDFSTSSPNLPQSLAIFAEANDANQGTLNLAPTKVTSAKQVGQLYGFGSPAYLIMRILEPLFGGGIGGIPITVYAQATAMGATPKILGLVPTGTATGNGTHTLYISGRGVLDGVGYDINIKAGDTTHDITTKAINAVNAVLGAPVIGTQNGYEALFQSKWSGATANELNIYVETYGNSLGITYSIPDIQDAIGTPSVANSLTLIGNAWVTAIINSYGAVPSVLSAFESWNGIPDPINPTGRFQAIVGKPAVVLTGSVLDNPASITSTRPTQVTIALCPAPGSKGFSFEAAANMAAVYLPIAQNNPELDASGNSYPDMPTPTSIGSMSDYNNRSAFLLLGSSTVDLVQGAYQVKDFITTYAPIGENPPQFRYVRTLYQVDMNVKFTYQLKEQIFVVGKVIANDNDILSVSDYVKPKMWRSEISTMAADLVKRGLIVDEAFTESNTSVSISTTNPNRFNTSFKYKRSGVALVSSTTAIGGFNFGTLN